MATLRHGPRRTNQRNRAKTNRLPPMIKRTRRKLADLTANHRKDKWPTDNKRPATLHRQKTLHRQTPARASPKPLPPARGNPPRKEVPENRREAKAGNNKAVRPVRNNNNNNNNRSAAAGATTVAAGRQTKGRPTERATGNSQDQRRQRGQKSERPASEQSSNQRQDNPSQDTMSSRMAQDLPKRWEKMPTLRPPPIASFGGIAWLVKMLLYVAVAIAVIYGLIRYWANVRSFLIAAWRELLTLWNSIFGAQAGPRPDRGIDQCREEITAPLLFILRSVCQRRGRAGPAWCGGAIQLRGAGSLGR